MHEKLIAAYDFGTSGCKIALIDLKGVVKSSAYWSYDYETNTQGWAEVNPDVYWDALCRVTSMALSKGHFEKQSICALSIATIWRGIIPVDATGDVLYNNILWLDGRASIEAEMLCKTMGTTYFSDKDYWPKLLWYKTNRPELYEKTAQILEVSTYLRYRLTGETVTALPNHFTKSTDPVSQNAFDQFLRIAGIDKALFPPLVDSSAHVGNVTASAAEKTGIPADIPVYAGCTDLMAIPIGSGASGLGDSHVYLGTSGWFGQITPLSKRKSCFLAAPCTVNTDITFYGLNTACPAVDWTISRFYPQELKEMGNDIYAFLEKDLASIPAGSGGLLASTWLRRERPPVHKTAQGVFLNIHFQHTRQHFVTAMREAAAYMLRWNRERTEQLSGIHSEIIRVAGGGAMSDHWMQILANVLKTPVEVPASPQFAGALGAAACALVGMGELTCFEEIKTLTGTAKCFEPMDCGSVYDEMYLAFRELGALNNIFDKLNQIKEKEVLYNTPSPP